MLYALAAVLIAIAGLLAYAATRPDHFRIERSAVIAAPPETIRPLIADFRAWRDWSPWEAKDPAMKRMLSGAEAGVGAVYGWEGNGQVGTGRMEIVEDAPRRVAIKLDFLKPFEAHNLAEFTLAPEGAGTRVTWAMSGPQPFIAKLMGIVFSMERMVGPDFEAGLANLKRRAEG
ncbi:SRPBCC family protein [Phreatobacter cathodiphilus]|uniref:Polyketide cyclase n=1 Tax=Phreatobacter cathodiphilus TaxID=1868589 RepID=A0A2S0NEK1_9HYPH|nr:SRPBCC family protein [Phreatobacter cathodiphilus]AVO46497.1 polyketide cyclase [Phreatobacter cathodiphilus]